MGIEFLTDNHSFVEMRVALKAHIQSKDKRALGEDEVSEALLQLEEKLNRKPFEFIISNGRHIKVSPRLHFNSE